MKRYTSSQVELSIPHERLHTSCTSFNRRHWKLIPPFSTFKYSTKLTLFCFYLLFNFLMLKKNYKWNICEEKRFLCSNSLKQSIVLPFFSGSLVSRFFVVFILFCDGSSRSQLIWNMNPIIFVVHLSFLVLYILFPFFEYFISSLRSLGHNSVLQRISTI